MQVLLWIVLSVGLAQAGGELLETLSSYSSSELFDVEEFLDLHDSDDEDDDEEMGPVEDEFTGVPGPEKMEFVLIRAGSFFMGGDEADQDTDEDELPLHEVRISRDFYMGRHLVTQAEWERVMGENPSHFLGSARPVENVSWDDVQVFLQSLNRSGEYGICRLPTEAEWEYAARAGSSGPYLPLMELAEYAWYRDNSEGRTHPVGGLKPNAWGLYDMYGNVWEWVQDFYDGDYYAASPDADPPGPEDGEERVVRGCSWNDRARCRSSFRLFDEQDARDPITGFRLVCSQP
ncbi:MAG: formylglycine-generating enzyme family protein [Desulfovibrionaceae bacterium]|nr:formylglycine-generating enzyme family protein [Desulfovibrionaceae bacterium]